MQISDNTDTALVSAAGALITDNSGVTQPVSGTITANAGTGDYLSVTGHTRNEAFKEASALGGELDDTAPVAATEGNVSPARITAQRALHANLRNDAGTEVGTAGAPVRVDPTGVTAQPVTLTSTTVTAISAGDNNIGNVDIVTLPALVAGTANIGDVDVLTLPNVTLAAGTNTNEVVGDAAHDAVAAGNPVLVAASHETIADSAPTNRLATVTDGDVTRLSAMDGALFVIPSGPQQWKARLVGAMTDTTVKAAPGVGLSLYIQTVVFSIGAATASSILLEESTTIAVFGPHYLEAVNGRGIAVQCVPPIKIAANTLLSATGTGSTTATLDVYGFTGPG